MFDPKDSFISNIKCSIGRGSKICRSRLRYILWNHKGESELVRRNIVCSHHYTDIVGENGRRTINTKEITKDEYESLEVLDS